MFKLGLIKILIVAGLSWIPLTARSDDLVTYDLTDGRTVTPLEVFQECDACPEMIVMPLGAFHMGAKIGESRNPFDIFSEDATMRRREPWEINVIPPEHPRHRVEIDIPFAIGRNEVSHREWMKCFEAGECSHNPEHRIRGPQGFTDLGPDHPVINVSFQDILEYVDWLNSSIGAGLYRLPTEAEWEYAARAGTETRFAQGEDLTADQANFSRAGTEQIRGEEMPDLENRRLPVRVDDLNAANSWGLRHMSGNVRERVLSCWSKEHLGLPRSSDYLAISLLEQECLRVSKGGSFTGGMDYLRLAARGRSDETYRRDNFGFRLIRQFTETGVE